MLIGREPLTPMERLQEATERMYLREDEELRERIAAERFDEHKTKGSEDNVRQNLERQDGGTA